MRQTYNDPFLSAEINRRKPSRERRSVWISAIQSWRCVSHRQAEPDSQTDWLKLKPADLIWLRSDARLRRRCVTLWCRQAVGRRLASCCSDSCCCWRLTAAAAFVEINRRPLRPAIRPICSCRCRLGAAGCGWLVSWPRSPQCPAVTWCWPVSPRVVPPSEVSMTAGPTLSEFAITTNNYPRQGGYVFTGVCLLIGLSAHKITQKLLIKALRKFMEWLRSIGQNLFFANYSF